MGISIKLTIRRSQATLANQSHKTYYGYMMKVVGLGQCSLDHLFVVDSYPEKDTKKELTEWLVSGGGPVATALVSLSRLGIECSFFGITGDDDSGDRIRESLRSENVEISGLMKRQNSSSQIAFIAVEKGSGKRTIFWKRPSAESLGPEELPSDFPGDAHLLLLDGLMKGASLYAAEKARSVNIPVMLDAGHVRDGMLQLVSLCDYVVGSEEFARELLGTEDPFSPGKAIEAIHSYGVRTVTITLGDKGSITSSEDGMFHTPAFTVCAVDTTGAGDVFHGGYIYGLLQNWNIRDITTFASAFAAIKCRKLGGRAGIPSLDEVRSFLQSQSRSEAGSPQ
jgi:ribokinase